MKKTILLFVLVSISFYTFSQEPGESNNLQLKKNEIRLNILSSTLGMPEISYEYSLSDDFGLGVYTLAGLDYDVYNIKYGVLPYGRLYIGNKLDRGFFIEVNSGIFSHKVTVYETHYSDGIVQSITKSEYKIEPELGFAVGYKFLTKNNWVGDIFVGVGRGLSLGDGPVHTRVGISIGKKF